MIAVLDASAAISVVLAASGSNAFEKTLVDSESVLAPRLYVSETANALWKYLRAGHMDLEACETALDKVLALPDFYAEDLDLGRESLALAAQFRKPVYDMFYLVLARRHAATLITADRELAALARKSGVKTD